MGRKRREVRASKESESSERRTSFGKVEALPVNVDQKLVTTVKSTEIQMREDRKQCVRPERKEGKGSDERLDASTRF